MSVSKIIQSQLKEEDISTKKSLRESVDILSKSIKWAYSEMNQKLEQGISLENVPWAPQKDEKMAFLSKQIDELRKRLFLDYEELDNLEKRTNEVVKGK